MLPQPEAFAAQIRHALQDSREGLCDTVVSGRCSSFEQYKHIAGQIAGIDVALERITAELKRLAGPPIEQEKTDAAD